MSTQTSTNPATGSVIREYPVHTDAQVEDIIAKAHAAFGDWKKTSFETRANYLRKVADVLLANKEEYAKLIALEMGKPFAQGIAEVEKCAGCAKYFAENGAKHLSDHVVETEYKKSYSAFLPIGIVLAVMPWNFP